jgi:hypothetical protein
MYIVNLVATRDAPVNTCLSADVGPERKQSSDTGREIEGA